MPHPFQRPRLETANRPRKTEPRKRRPRLSRLDHPPGTGGPCHLHVSCRRGSTSAGLCARSVQRCNARLSPTLWRGPGHTARRRLLTGGMPCSQVLCATKDGLAGPSRTRGATHTPSRSRPPCSVACTSHDCAPHNAPTSFGSDAVGRMVRPRIGATRWTWTSTTSRCPPPHPPPSPAPRSSAHALLYNPTRRQSWSSTQPRTWPPPSRWCARTPPAPAKTVGRARP